jgi:hypothetical protein
MTAVLADSRNYCLCGSTFHTRSDLLTVTRLGRR